MYNLKFFSILFCLAVGLFLINSVGVFAAQDLHLVNESAQDRFDRFFRAVDDPSITEEEAYEFFYGVNTPDLNPRTDVTDVAGAKGEIVKWGNTFAAVIALIAVIMIIYGGYLYVTAGTNEDNTKKAKSILVYAVIGLAIAVLSYTIVKVAVSFIGNTNAPPASLAENTNGF